MLLACLILYCLGSALLSLFSALYEEDACFITRPKKVSGRCHLSACRRSASQAAELHHLEHATACKHALCGVCAALWAWKGWSHDQDAGAQAAGDLALRVSSRLPRYSDRYSLVVSDKAKHKPDLTSLWKPNLRSAAASVNMRCQTRASSSCLPMSSCTDDHCSYKKRDGS